MFIVYKPKQRKDGRIWFGWFWLVLVGLVWLELVFFMCVFVCVCLLLFIVCCIVASVSIYFLKIGNSQLGFPNFGGF